MAAHFAGALVFRPPRAGEVAAHDALGVDPGRAANQHGAARELGRPRDAASAQLLRTVSQVLAYDGPALLVAAVVHGELISASPFASHNGLVARAAERLVLVARGLDPTSLVVPEAGHLKLRPAYESSVAGLRDGGASGGQQGVHRWLLYAAEAFAAGAEASPLRDA